MEALESPSVTLHFLTMSEHCYFVNCSHINLYQLSGFMTGAYEW